MFSPFAAGRKVYGNGSYAPNRGQLNPAGYIKRELAKRGGVSRYGMDGNSDTRSGLAAAALQRHIGPHPVQPGPHHPGVGGGQGRPVVRPVGAKGPQVAGNNPHAPEGKTTHTTTTKPPTGPNTTGPQTATTTKVEVTPPPPPVPTVTINKDGTLELPYNPEYADNVLQAQQQYQQNMLQNQQETQNENLSYQTTLRDGEYAAQDQRRSTLNENAAGGTAFSSRYGAQVGDNARVYNNALNDLNSQHNLKQQALTADRSNNQNTLNQYLQSLALQYGINLSGDAGSLGLDGQPPIVQGPAPIPGHPSTKPSPKWVKAHTPPSKSKPKNKPSPKWSGHHQPKHQSKHHSKPKGK